MPPQSLGEMEHPGSLLRGLQRNSRAAAELSQEKLNKLLDQMQHLPNAHRFQALQEMLGQLGPSQRLDLLHEMLEVKLTHHERLKFMEDPEIVGYFFEYAHDHGHVIRSTPHRRLKSFANLVETLKFLKRPRLMRV